jgi:outer membrane protein OmpA-like peptidoglycan-associated protein
MALANGFPSSSLFALALVCGCASTPAPTVSAVRTEYEQVAATPHVAKHASIQLNDAQQSLLRLEATSKGDRTERAHLTYVTRQRIEIARVAGALGAFEAEIETLGEQRDELRLNARTREADDARAESAENLAAALTARSVAASAMSESRENLADAKAARAESAENLADAQAAQSVAASAIDRAHQLEMRIQELKAEQTERGLVMTMRGVLFASGSAQLQPGAERALGEVAGLLNDFPDRGIAVEGHTDSVGSDAYNQGLSERRAQSVASFLRSRGVAAPRVESRGLGEAMPVASNDDGAGRQANRRVEIVLADASKTPPVSARD